MTSKLLTLALIVALATPAGAITSVTCEGLSNKECVALEVKARAFKAQKRAIAEFLKRHVVCVAELQAPLDQTVVVCDFDESYFDGCSGGTCGFVGRVK
jgi:hypothetical protein